MKNYFSSDFKLGVLGGGQLGRMLLTETQKLDIYTVILDNNAKAPCAQVCNEFHQGNLFDFDTVYNFGKKVDVLTIEIENVNIDALDKLEAEGLLDVEVAKVGNRLRKYYKLTENGTKETANRLAEMQEFLKTMQHLVNPKFSIE